MLTESDFIAAAAELAKLNSISEDQAADYLAKIGDTPEMAEDGRVIVRNDGGAEIARVICLAE